MRLVSEATRLHRDRFDGRKTIDTKSSASDLVSEVDRDCEMLLVETLKESGRTIPSSPRR